MHLSTSSSEAAARYLRAAWVLVSGVVLICIAIEALSGWVLDRSSLTQQRINAELPAVLRLRQGSAEKKSILIVGNSLLVEGLKPDLLQADLGKNYQVAPLLIESTSYFDWYYGLRRLFREGSRPDIVIVGLAATMFLERQVRPDYFSQNLLDRRDTLAVSHDLGYSRTAAASLFAGTLSRFWGNRSVIRNRVLDTVFPGMAVLARTLARRPKPGLTQEQFDAQLERVLPSRLSALHLLCQQYGAELVILLPPVAEANDHLAVVSKVAHTMRTSVILPLHSETLTASDFSDGIHLTDTRAIDFTHATATAINQCQKPVVSRQNGEGTVLAPAGTQRAGQPGRPLNRSKANLAPGSQLSSLRQSVESATSVVSRKFLS